MEYVIRYDSEKHPGYYRGNGTMLPALGATLEETPKYSSMQQAEQVRLRFPIVAQIMCGTYPVDTAKRMDEGLKRKKQRTATKTKRKAR